MKDWPFLSQQLEGPRHPEFCQCCGLHQDQVDDDLARWIEHDENDLPTPVVVVLCRRCSARLIKPHPRLYDDLERNAPHPGCMAICIRCRNRNGVGCTHPALKANGGEGLIITCSKPQAYHISCATGRGRKGFIHRLYLKPPSECAGRHEIEAQPVTTWTGQVVLCEEGGEG